MSHHSAQILKDSKYQDNFLNSYVLAGVNPYPNGTITLNDSLFSKLYIACVVRQRPN